MGANSTKARIAEALRQLMKKQAFQKISVKTLMDVTNMKRQSFYYHFQDTREVLEWICRQELEKKLAVYDAPFPDRIVYAMTLLDADRNFYRQVIHAAPFESVQAFSMDLLRPWFSQVLYGIKEPERLTATEYFVVNFSTQACVNYLMHFVESRVPLDTQKSRAQVCALLDAFGLPADPSCQHPHCARTHCCPYEAKLREKEVDS